MKLLSLAMALLCLFAAIQGGDLALLSTVFLALAVIPLVELLDKKQADSFAGELK